MIAVCLVLSLLPLTGCAGGSPPSNEELWAAAMADAVFSGDHEAMELVCLTQADPQVIWDEGGDRVLPVTWHDYEEPCRPGDGVARQDIWATSLGEVEDWHQENSSGVTDWDLRFAQLLAGALAQAAVGREDVIRPRLAAEEILGLWNSRSETEVVRTFRCGTLLEQE